MSFFTVFVIIGVLMIIGGIALLGTPLLTFMSEGYFIIILFFVSGCFGVIRCIREKRYDKEFGFSVLSLILGIAGLVTPGAAAMTNFAILYMAAAFFFIHGILAILGAIERSKEDGDTGMLVLGIVLGVLELILGCYSVAHPAVLALALGTLIGFYFIETGISVIVTGSAVCRGSNNMTILFVAMGVVTILGGFFMISTPLITFLGIGYGIIILFFLNGVLGIIRAVGEKRYDKDFFFAILSVILGIIGAKTPGVADMNSFLLIYLAAAWFFIHAVLTIITTLKKRKEGAGFIATVIGIVLGVVELILGCYTVTHPSIPAAGMGILIGIYFIESGAGMIFIGSGISRAVAEYRDNSL